MRTLPYKFIQSPEKLEKQYRWNRFWDMRKGSSDEAKYGTLTQNQQVTHRIDIRWDYFKAAGHNIRKDLRDLIISTFDHKAAKRLLTGHTIVMTWTTDAYWLNDRVVRETMEDWNSGDAEPRAVWKEAIHGVKRIGYSRRTGR